MSFHYVETGLCFATPSIPATNPLLVNRSPTTSITYSEPTQKTRMADLSTYLTSPLQALKQLHPDRLATLQNANLMTAMYILHNRPKEAVQVITQAKEQIKDSENDKEFLEMEGMAKMAMVWWTVIG